MRQCGPPPQLINVKGGRRKALLTLRELDAYQPLSLRPPTSHMPWKFIVGGRDVRIESLSCRVELRFSSAD